MVSRHEVDKKAEGFRPGEDGYPSPGRAHGEMQAKFFWPKSARIKELRSICD